MIEDVEKTVRKTIGEEDLELIVSEIGLTADWSAAYTPNAGPQDAVVKIQLTEERRHSSQDWIRVLRERFTKDKRFAALEFSFDSGGLVRGALNEGKSSPINIQLLGKNQETLFAVADRIKRAVADVDGVVDARVIQRPDAPQLNIEVDRVKAAGLNLTQDDIMKNVIAATNSSITYNKKNFWIDPVTTNQYFVGVQYPESKIKTINYLLNIPIMSPLRAPQQSPAGARGSNAHGSAPRRVVRGPSFLVQIHRCGSSRPALPWEVATWGR
jgi:multidrug efflux pump subunit AcrB